MSAEMHDDRKTDPGGLKPSDPPALLPDAVRYAEAFDAMCTEFRRMAKAYEDVIALLTKRPSWADDIMVAVGKIESSRALQAKVETLEAEVIEIKQWQAKHEDGCGHPDCPRKAVAE